MMRILFFLLLFSPLWSESPLAVYLTWQHNPCTTMTIQWITDASHASDQLEYREPNEAAWMVQHGFHQPLPEGNNFFLHRIEIENLKPGQAYIFRIPEFESTYRFKTIEDSLAKPLTFVVGGDIYHDGLQVIQQTNLQAAKQNPAFALVGGDLAYSCSRMSWLSENRQRWLDWLGRWTADMVTEEGNLIPMIPAIGNHDCKGGFYQDSQRASYFYTLFPFPGSNGYNVFDIGNFFSLFVLDSSVTHPVEGEQTHWLHQEMEARQHVPHKFALYHVPAYPSVRPFNFKISPMIRKYWVPLFEKYRLNAAFENHEHAYKRTYPIRNNRRDNEGVLYLGDGAWGILNPRIPKSPKQAWYIALSAPIRHFIAVTVEKDKRTYRAIDFTGKVIDEYMQ